MSYWASASIKTRTHVHPYCVAFVTIMATLVTKMGMVFDLYLKTFAMKTWLVLLKTTSRSCFSGSRTLLKGSPFLW